MNHLSKLLANCLWQLIIRLFQPWNQKFIILSLQGELLPSPCSSYLHTVVTRFGRHGATLRWWCLMMHVTLHRRYQQHLQYVYTSRCSSCVPLWSPGPLFVLLSEWQLCAPHAVVGSPTEALLPGADFHSSHLFRPLGVLLPLRHGSADLWTGGGYSHAGNHWYVGFHGGINAELFQKLKICFSFFIQL